MKKETLESSSRTIIAILSASELSLGSYLHQFHIPFSGQLMALNQCFWLNVSKCWAPAVSAFKLSLIVAGAKAMSPFGKRVTPMVAIGVQGLLFEVGWCLGRNLFGRLLGSVGMSLWPLIQPLLFYGMFAGKELPDLIAFYSTEWGGVFFYIIAAAIAIKIMLGCIVCLLASYLSREAIKRYGHWIRSIEKQLEPEVRSTSWRKRLFSPIVIGSLVVGVYLFNAASSWEEFWRRMIFYIAWGVAISYLYRWIKTRGARFLTDIQTLNPLDVDR